MQSAALIGTQCTLGKFWSARRFFDYVIEDENARILGGKDLTELSIICPSLWQGKLTTDKKKVISSLKKYTALLGEIRAERVTYVTGLDLLAPEADENTPLIDTEGDEYLTALREMHELINSRFGRVLVVRIADLFGAGDGFSIMDELCKKDVKKLKTPLLEHHQFYPTVRIVNDVEQAWRSGLSVVNLVSEPLTTYDIVEHLAPHLEKKLPIAKASDPIGSMRKSLYAFHFADVNTGYTMNKSDVLRDLGALYKNKLKAK